MRKFKFFALAFAALSLAACSDDAIDGQGGNTGVSSEETTPAYLTIAFSANSVSSSRADREDINTGDKDGVDVDNDGTTDGAEDSGHHNNGEDAENKVHTALVVIVPNDGETGGSYFC